MKDARFACCLVVTMLATGCPPPPPAVTSWSSSESDTAASDPAPRSCSGLPGDSASGVHRIDPDGVGGDDPFEVFCEQEIGGGGWILVGRIGKMAEIDQDAFDWNLDVAGLLSNDEPAEFQYSHFDLSRFDAYGSEWTVMVQVDMRAGLPPLPDYARYTFFRARDGETVVPGTVGRDWQGLGLERFLEHLTVSRVSGAWAAGRNNTTWLPSDGSEPGWPYTSFHLMGHVDKSFDMFGNGVVLTPDCIDDDDQTRGCFQTAGMLDDDPNGLREGVGGGSPYRDDGPPGDHGHWAHYWIRDDRLDAPHVE